MPLLTLPPTGPQRGDRTTFASRVDAFITWLINFVTEMLALVAGLNTLAAGGAYAIPYTVDLSSTADADPTSGKLRFNAATQNAATALFVDLIGGDTIDYTSILDQFDASTSAVKGQIRIVKQGDPTKFLTFDVTARTTATGYRKLSLTNTGGSSANPFVTGDGVLIKFTRTGDRGDPGSLTQVLWVRDEKAGGTSAGASVGGGQVTRTLNTVKKNTITGASVASDIITLPAGTYRIEASVPAYGVLNHRAFLLTTSGGSTTAVEGTSAYASGTQTCSAINKAEITIAAGGGTVKIQHLIAQTVATNGLGLATSMGGTEVYTDVFIEKVA